tara:strand:- start:678 stop:833 length:156 start_codon:yes stop_codon:yes gene_type:complete
MKEIMNEIEKKFEAALQEKTSWGKNDVLELYRKISSKVYLDRLSELMERRN